MKYKLKIMMNWNLWGYAIVLFLLNHWFDLLHFWLQLDYMCAHWHFNLLLSLHKDEASIVEKWNQPENDTVGKSWIVVTVSIWLVKIYVILATHTTRKTYCFCHLLHIFCVKSSICILLLHHFITVLFTFCILS